MWQDRERGYFQCMGIDLKYTAFSGSCPKLSLIHILLLGQNVNSYGKNLEEPITFAQLLQDVERIEGLERIRFLKLGFTGDDFCIS